jgi:hypothetical protein
MGFPVTERGGPPGGGGIGRPVALLGAWAGAEGGGVAAAGALVAGGADPYGAAGAGAGVAGAGVAGAGVAGACAAGAGAAGADAAGTAGAGEGGGAEPVGGEDLTALAAGGRNGEGALGCSDAGRLVINLVEERLGGIGGAGLWMVSVPVVSPPEVLPPLSPPVASGGVAVSMVAGAVSSLAAAFLVAAFLSEGAGSSGWTGRRSPSRSALRRARSACASSMDDEWLLTPIPRDRQRSSASLLVSPSS